MRQYGLVAARSIVVVMTAITGYFVPLPVYEGARARGCFTCSHWHGELSCVHVVCERFEKASVTDHARLAARIESEQSAARTKGRNRHAGEIALVLV